MDLQEQAQGRRESSNASQDMSHPRFDDEEDSLVIEPSEGNFVAPSSLRRSTRRRPVHQHQRPVESQQRQELEPLPHDPVGSSLQNPLAIETSAFMKAKDGRPCKSVFVAIGLY